MADKVPAQLGEDHQGRDRKVVGRDERDTNSKPLRTSWSLQGDR